MAKLVLILVFVCFQFSSQEELVQPAIELGKPEIEVGKPENEVGKPENEIVKPVNELVQPENELVQPEILSKDSESLDGADKNQWQPNKIDITWTEEDEKWLQELQELLASGEDNDSLDSEEFDKLMAELDKYFEDDDESEEYSDEWYKEDENWDIDLDHYPDYFDSQKESNAINNYLDLYYSWLYKLQIKDPQNKKQLNKRFTSV